MTRRRRGERQALWVGLCLTALAQAAHAQVKPGPPGSALHLPPEAPVSPTEPVYYQADSATYDRDTGIATLIGHVEIWQGQRVLRADKVTYDRNTGVAAASGHVVLLDPNGQVMFADYAELSQGMKNGILSNIRAQLAENGHLAANGARRTDARINDFSRVVYSSCNACKEDPNGPLLWQIRARSAVQDLDDKRIEYYDTVVDMFGIPVMYLPYFTTPDPSAKRSSGLLFPNLGYTKYLGAFIAQPYYWVIDGSTDATITPWLSTRNGPALDLQFRRAFNDGNMTINTSIAHDEGSIQADVFAKGQFAINDEWRWGFDIERATTETFLRDYSVPGWGPALTSTVYLEGFGQGSYSRLDTFAYQGLVTSQITARMPFVLPRYEYDFVGEPDALGGRTTVQVGAFNVLRQLGTNTRRASLSLDWERPFTGALGDLWKLVLHTDSAAYDSTRLDQEPSFGETTGAAAAQAMPTAALEGRWPFARSGGGTQIIEPIVQLIAAPRSNSYSTVYGPNGAPLYVNTNIPNEDSFDFEFTDANLFALNRFPGIDRLEGGTRANVALHGTWYFGNGQSIDGLIGQGYRTASDPAFPIHSGLNGTTTDVVSHLSYTPSQYLDFTTRQRFSHDDMSLQFFDGLATFGPSWLKFNAGYIFEKYNPYTYYDVVPTGILTTKQTVTNQPDLNTGPVNETTFGINTKYGNWRLGASMRRDMFLDKMDYAGGNLTYEDECFILSANFYRRFTSIDGDNGDTVFYFQITLKTIGSFNVNAL